MTKRTMHVWFLCSIIATLGSFLVAYLIMLAPEAWPIWALGGITMVIASRTLRPTLLGREPHRGWVRIAPGVRWYEEARERKARPTKMRVARY